jgi:hypothetical protein
MRKALGILALSVSALMVGSVHAAEKPIGLQRNNLTWLQSWDQWADQYGEQFETWIDGVLGVPDVDGNTGGSGPVAAPELDPAGAMAAVTLLAGGLAVLRGRCARKR